MAMDPLISKLSQQISEKIKNKPIAPGEVGGGQQPKFEQVLSDKRAEQNHQLNIDNLVNEPKGEMQVLSAENVTINMANSETGSTAGGQFDPKKKFFGIFEDLNSDMLSLDSSLEVLANPDVKLNKRQLLAYQAGIGNMTINSELFSRLAQTVAQNLNTLLQTNVG